MIQPTRPVTALASRIIAKQALPLPLARPAASASVGSSGSRGFASLSRGGYGSLNRGGYASLSRGGYTSLPRGGYGRPVLGAQRGGYGVIVPQQQQVSIRWKSDSSPSLRKWGFEEITSSLPTDSASPTHHPILIDVREPAELTATGIIPSAVSVPLGSQPDALFLTPEEFETRFGFPKPGMAEGESKDPVVFYCKAGVRARTAAQLAVQAGYDADRVGVYEGSWLEWAKKGGRVEKWEGGN
ncbi:Rhodanese-like protein [Aspergillus campestris IBT 28561]|uniref:Sulfurtransferase n=1 Tax=Aspergillus campestris (strain IBT 28561) TaxID=1392248 RepID=A0A2I1D361_ASPC2|nr:Rhodanese-like protein [Aspergillus campestris IBT 28561]PKY04320.1 Rhodanese-like protein [Aspergillus campestris IBT 28561]